LAPPPKAAAFKNRSFLDRLGYAVAGITIVFSRERSFRTQSAFAAGVLVVGALLPIGPLWAALAALCVGMVLALEMINASLEYLMDLLHPEVAEEIKHAKDAAAGAVLIASCATVAVGLLMLVAWLQLS
jgi:diacylglycerol kinase (ATP)